MSELLTIQDVILAAIIAAVLTPLAIKIYDFFSILKKNSAAIETAAKDIDLILEKCYDLFPKDMMQFGGEIYKRGMKVRIITVHDKIFEGKFLGFNNDNMICMMTKKFIIAHAITNISEMEEIKR